MAKVTTQSPSDSTITVPILPGRVGNLTPDQQHTLDEFKEHIKAEGTFVASRHNDHYILRFLRARRFYLPAAHSMFIDCENWRKELGVDSLIETFNFEEEADVRAVYPRYYHNIDKLGRPIYIEHIGRIDIKALFKITEEERMIKQHVLSYEKLINERMPACSRAARRHIEQCCTILDLKGVSIRQFASAFGFIKRTSDIAQNYYPEMMGKMFIINAPMMFTSVWTMVKPLLDEVTVSKIVILGSNYQKQLLKDIEASNIPSSIGGTCKCPGGCDADEPGPWKDPRYMNEKH